MSNEYDYSGLYRNDNKAPDASAQPGSPSGANPSASQNTQSSYPNVGSSGMNTANTAQTDYSTPNPGNAQNGGYNSSFGAQAGGGSGNNGGYNGYSYSSAPQQPPRPAKKHPKARKVLLRVVAGVGVVVLGFGGGLAGTVAANRLGLTGGQVVVQTVERNTDTTAVSQGSAGDSSLSLQDVAAIVQPSVVAITTEEMVGTSTWFGGSFVQSGAGSGVIISADGYILTCAHVVSGASSISVQLSDNSTYTATLVGADSQSDIAVIKIDATGLTPAVIGDSDALVVGEDAIAVGNPLGTLGGTVTNGIISAVNRSVTVENNEMNLIQTNASISPGNSGGGLFNGNGELIGIVNAKSGYDEAEGLGFAIPINSAMEIAQELINTGYVKRPALGVTLIDITDANTAMQYGVSGYGPYVYQVTEGGGAAVAGIQQGDRIVSVDDTAVSTTNEIKSYLQDKAVGDTVVVQVEREGKLMSFNVTLGESTQ